MIEGFEWPGSSGSDTKILKFPQENQRVANAVLICTEQHITTREKTRNENIWLVPAAFEDWIFLAILLLYFEFGAEKRTQVYQASKKKQRADRSADTNAGFLMSLRVVYHRVSWKWTWNVHTSSNSLAILKKLREKTKAREKLTRKKNSRGKRGPGPSRKMNQNKHPRQEKNY